MNVNGVSKLVWNNWEKDGDLRTAKILKKDSNGVEKTFKVTIDDQIFNKYKEDDLKKIIESSFKLVTNDTKKITIDPDGGKVYHDLKNKKIEEIDLRETSENSIINELFNIFKNYKPVKIQTIDEEIFNA